MTEQWQVGPAEARARLYHSNAVLLQDASVLVMGGGAPGPQNNLNVEVYYPSYLYNSAGGFATRPVVQSAPGTLDIGETFDVTMGGSGAVSRVVLIKTTSATHSWNMEQRFIELTRERARENEAILGLAGKPLPGPARALDKLRRRGKKRKRRNRTD